MFHFFGSEQEEIHNLQLEIMHKEISKVIRPHKS